MLDFKIVTTTDGVDWVILTSLLAKENMATYSTEKHQLAFENSSKVIVIYDGVSLIGCGRLLADGAYQGVLYDIVVDSAYQGHGLGKMIVKELLKEQDDKNIMLYASPGKEGFYQTLGFHKAKTAMCRFINIDAAIKKGFIE